MKEWKKRKEMREEGRGKRNYVWGGGGKEEGRKGKTRDWAYKYVWERGHTLHRSKDSSFVLGSCLFHAKRNGKIEEEICDFFQEWAMEKCLTTKRRKEDTPCPPRPRAQTARKESSWEKTIVVQCVNESLFC